MAKARQSVSAAKSSTSLGKSSAGSGKSSTGSGKSSTGSGKSSAGSGKSSAGSGKSSTGSGKSSARSTMTTDAEKGSSNPFIVVGNLKGGSGKSTVVFNLAVWLATRNKSLHVLDLDPQKTLSDLIAVRDELDFEPRLEAPLTTLEKRPDDAWTLADIGAAHPDAMLDAARLADIILVPVLPGQADVWATQRYLQLVDPVRKKDSKIMLFVNRGDPPNAERETMEALGALKMMAKALDGARVLPVRLGRRVAFTRSLSEGQAVFELEARSKASEEFNQLARTVTRLR